MVIDILGLECGFGEFRLISGWFKISLRLLVLRRFNLLVVNVVIVLLQREDLNLVIHEGTINLCLQANPVLVLLELD